MRARRLRCRDLYLQRRGLIYRNPPARTRAHHCNEQWGRRMSQAAGVRLGLLIPFALMLMSPSISLAETERWKVHISRVSGDNNICIDGSVGTVHVENGRLRVYDLGMENPFPYFTIELEKDGSANKKRTPLTQFPNARVIVSTPPGSGSREIRIASPKTACVLLVVPR